MNPTNIEWTDFTWNPIRGCSRVSEGCRNCYAEKVAQRFSGPGQPYEGLVRLDLKGHTKPGWNGNIHFIEKHLLDPLRWREPRRIFVNSMSDLFHENVKDEWIDLIFGVMAHCPQHIFQVLTKRPERMMAWASAKDREISIYDALADAHFADEREADRLICRGQDRILKPSKKYGLVFDCKYPLPNVQLGVSVENQATANERIPLLLQTPAAVRFISAEPLLGPIQIPEYMPNKLWNSLPSWKQPELDWVIVGGESGPGARPMHPDWARSLRDQCQASEVPFFFKQWGEWKPAERGDPDFMHERGGMRHDGSVTRWADRLDGEPLWSIRVGKHATGAMLDGREWREFPTVQPCQP